MIDIYLLHNRLDLSMVDMYLVQNRFKVMDHWIYTLKVEGYNAKPTYN